MPDELDPPRKHYGFKEREFKRDNPRATSVPPMPTATELAKLAGGPVVPAAPKNMPKADDPNDVHTVLAQNRQVEQKFGSDDIGIKKVGTRRQRDYWLVFGSVELIGAAVVGFGVKQHNPFFLVYGISGMVIFGIAITWIMWQLVEPY